jgi:hypothetical protein
MYIGSKFATILIDFLPAVKQAESRDASLYVNHIAIGAQIVVRCRARKSINEFLSDIQQIAELSSWRTQEQIPSTHWWWYLDVLANLPAPILAKTRQKSMPEAAVT